jgi:hypothetical protein
MKYNLVIDYGKPYEEEKKTEEEVLKKLEEIDNINKEEYAYFDVWIYDEKENDITEEMFSEYFNYAYPPIIEINNDKTKK